MLAYKTEDEVRDEARILLNLTNNEDKTKSGVGQLTSFSSLIAIFLILSFSLFSQNTNETNFNNTNSGKYGVLSASLELVAYGRMSDLIEQTGNEDTLGVLLYGDLS